MDLILDETGTQRLIGYVVDIGAGDGTAACRLDLDDRHLNRQGMLHGGLAATLLDSAMGTTGSLTVDPTGRHPFTTLSLTVNYVAPGRPGIVEARGRITGGGRSTLFIEGALRHQDGTLIATATGVFRKSRQEP
ncbi:PaaI family thioesterase [Paracoccus zeaxanthinifaciens]|uniref:PaaI family thioesterase n=1 Tax=Paracoccus zeaxanthinifaciens TaxID=187400 RepID=UPI0003B71831|nr:PaaI family thioesterase [Paracoccus zeaxanthinifaciens]